MNRSFGRNRLFTPDMLRGNAVRVNSSARATQVVAAAVQTAAVYIGLTPIYDDDHL